MSSRVIILRHKSIHKNLLTQWTLSKVKKVKTCKESLITSAHEEQNFAVGVVPMHDRVFRHIYELMACFAL